MFIKRKLLKLVFVWMGIGVLFASNLKAQHNLVIANSANIFDSKAGFSNPAVLYFQQSKLMLGMKVFHVGFMENDKLGFRNNYFCLSSPSFLSDNIVLGITGQYFGIPLYKQSQFSFHVSHKLINRLTVGLKYNILSHAYDRSQFDQIDSWDPVFSNGTAKISNSFGLGILFFPISDLSFGFSWDHINRPDVSLIGDGTRQPYLFNFGVRYSYKLLSTSINMNIFQNSPTFSWMLESIFPEKGLVRVGYEINALKLEGQLHVMNGISLNYGYDYPLYDLNEISSGSHQVGIVYDFDYKPGIVLDTMDFPEYYNKKDVFFVAISSDQLKIINKKIKRTFSEDITKDNINNLNDFEVGKLDSSLNDAKFYNPNYVTSSSPEETESNPKLSDTYKEYLQKISDQLQDRGNKKIVVYNLNKEKNNRITANITPSVKKQVVVKPLKNRTTIEAGLSLEQYEKKTTLLFPEKVNFEILRTRRSNYEDWKLEIKNYWGNIVRIFQGTGTVPVQIEWDWRDIDGELLQPGEYFYTFYWTNSNGNLLKTKESTFSVIKIIRHLNVEITTKPKQEVDLNKSTYKIKLNN